VTFTQPPDRPVRQNRGVGTTETADAAGRLRIVWFAGVAWDSVRGTDQQLAQVLSERADILYVDPPRSIVRGVPLRRSAPTRVAPGLLRMTPMALPGPHRRGIRRLTRRLVRYQVHRALAGRRTDVVISTSLDDVLTTVPEALQVLVGTDDYVAGAALLRQSTSALLIDEQNRIDEADLVTAVTPNLARRWERMSGRRVEILPNGCDAENLREAVKPDGSSRPLMLTRPVVGFVGNISERIDVQLLEAIADAGLSLLLVGPRRESYARGRFERLVARPGVLWLGPKPYGELPAFLGAMDVGITPYIDDDFNRASFPLKTLEYLAAGLPVVSTPLPATDALQTPLIRIASTPSEFVREVRAAFTESKDPQRRSERMDFAGRHSWRARATQLMELIESHLSRPTRGVQTETSTKSPQE
jgi:teichuronic acid biosynthesis glycosyltransferase TuaH